MNSTMKESLVSGGWCLGNEEWYPAWAGKRGTKYPHQAKISADGMRMEVVNRNTNELVMSFGTVAELSAWCDENGQSSHEVGPYNGPWD